MRKIFLGLVCLFLMPLAAHAEGPPSRADIEKVLGYYFDGSGAPVLVDMKLCTEIHREGELKNTCREEVAPNAVASGQDLFLWMNFFVPSGEKPDILVQFNHGGLTRDTRAFNVEGAVRYRTWRKVSFPRSGEWTVPVFFESASGAVPLSELHVMVN